MTPRKRLPVESGSETARPVAVFAHVHYPEVWSGIARLLAERMNVPFRLIITSSLAIQNFDEPPSPFHRGTLVIPVENRGRDIRPFLIALGLVADFDIGLKLHTKRSTHLLEGDDWREEILSSLVPPEPNVERIERAFATHERIGLIAPHGLLLPIRDWILRNRRPMMRVSALLDRRLEPKTFAQGYFAAGSMFWFRRSALAGFVDRALPTLFEEERGQVDGTIAHAVERLFALKAEQDGYLSLPMNALESLDQPLSDGELLRLSRSGSEVVSTFFQKPRIVRLLARHAPSTLRLYRALPIGLRRRLRDGIVGARKGTHAGPDP